jgi:hypothetical protein
MGYLIIKDLGYLSKQRQGSPASVISNNGDPISLLGSASVDVRSGVAKDDSPTAGSRVYPGTTLGSAEVTQWTIRVSFHKDNVAHQTAYKHLMGVYGSTNIPGIDKTEGVKALYYSDTDNVKKEPIELLGSTSTEFHGDEIPSGLPAVLVRVVKISSNPSPSNNVLPVSMTCEVV